MKKSGRKEVKEELESSSHNAFVLTVGACKESADLINQAHHTAKRIFGNLTSGISKNPYNGNRSFVIKPNESKEGWKTHRDYAGLRKAFIAYLETLASPVDMTPICFADEPRADAGDGKHAIYFEVRTMFDFKSTVTLSVDHSNKTLGELEKAKEALLEAFIDAGFKTKVKPIMRKTGSEEQKHRGYWIEYWITSPSKQ